MPDDQTSPDTTEARRDTAERKPNAPIKITPDAFHQMQLKSAETDFRSYDPDPPKPLTGRLACLDKPVELLLGAHGWPRRSGQPNPLRIKGRSNARKIAKDNLPEPTAAEIDQLADRINWLQNNAFRWQVRDGYAAYFEERNARVERAAEATNSVPVGEAAQSTADSEDRQASRAFCDEERPQGAAFVDHHKGADSARAIPSPHDPIITRDEFGDDEGGLAYEAGVLAAVSACSSKGSDQPSGELVAEVRKPHSDGLEAAETARPSSREKLATARQLPVSDDDRSTETEGRIIPDYERYFTDPFGNDQPPAASPQMPLTPTFMIRDIPNQKAKAFLFAIREREDIKVGR